MKEIGSIAGVKVFTDEALPKDVLILGYPVKGPTGKLIGFWEGYVKAEVPRPTKGQDNGRE